MVSFGEELASRIGATQRTLEADGARPLEGTAQAIRRKRAIRQGTTAGVAAIAAVAIAGGGTVAARRALDAQPAAYYLPPGGGEVLISVDGPNPTIPDIGIECGDPAPEPVLADDGYRVEVSVAESDDPFYAEYSYFEGTAKVFNENLEEFPAFVMQPDLVVVKDGAVVGVVPSTGLDNRLFFTPGRDMLPELFGASHWPACGGTAADDDRLPPGDYEVYVVTTVANSPEIAALSRMSLSTIGGTPWFDEDPWLEPNDWECRHMIADGVEHTAGEGAWYGSSSAACLPAQNPRAQWMPESRSLKLAYSDGIVRRVFETHLVAGPFAHTISEPSDGPFPVYEPWTVPPDAPLEQCGADLGGPADPSGVEFVSSDVTVARLRSGEDLEGWMAVPFGPGEVESRVARVITAADAPAIITIQGDVYSEVYGGWLPTSDIVGTASVTINGGDDVTVSRALGPARALVAVENIRWCTEAPIEGVVTLTVLGSQTISSEAGTSSADVYVIRAGHLE
jgi:hypothetical protein